MASKVLDLLIKVTDEASEQLEKIKGSTTGEGSGVAGLSENLLAAAGQAALAGMAIGKIASVVDDNIDDFVDYVLNVDRLATAFGLSIEEAEEVVLVADAMGLSNDALFSTMNRLVREGFEPGLEGLSSLREEFQDIEDPAERAGYLFDVAGEQGQKVLGPMVDMTDLDWTALIEGIEALANVDEEMVENAEALNLAAQGVEQAWVNLKLTLMNWAAPGLESLLNEINALLSGGGSPGLGEGSTWSRSTPQSIRHQDQNIIPATGQWGLGGGVEQEMLDALRNLPDDIADAVERSGGGLRR